MPAFWKKFRGVRSSASRECPDGFYSRTHPRGIFSIISYLINVGQHYKDRMHREGLHVLEEIFAADNREQQKKIKAVKWNFPKP